MGQKRADLSILQPFTRAQITEYVGFLRHNGAESVAALVEEALYRESTSGDGSKPQLRAVAR